MRGKRFETEEDIDNASLEDVRTYLYAGRWRHVQGRHGKWKRTFANGEVYAVHNPRQAAMIHFRVLHSLPVNNGRRSDT